MGKRKKAAFVQSTILRIIVKLSYSKTIYEKNLSHSSALYRQILHRTTITQSQKSRIAPFAITSFLVTSAVTLISLLSDIASQLTRFNDPRSPSSLSLSSHPFPSFFHNQSAALVPKCRKKGEAPLGHSVHNVEW